MKNTLILILLLVCGLTVRAQDTVFEEPPESGRAFALSMTETGLELGEIQPNFGGTIDIDYHPADPSRWARIDNFGILRFVDPGNATLVEGTYTFPPLFDGFEAISPEENKYFMREVEWSPDGRMLAFYIENQAVPDLDQGLWFWQPVQELSTDPSYQLLRPCPGYCSAAGVASNYPGWELLDFEWSSDNSSILVTTIAFEYGRRALTIRFAQRTELPPATVAPTFLLYDYGHWSNNGQQIVVSGQGPEGTVLFGTVDRAGGNPIVTLASDIGMEWVQDAVQQADGSLLMLGSTVSQFAPLQLVNHEGEQLTPPIGNAAPDAVSWSPNRRAVMLHIGEDVYVANVDGTVYEISDQIADSPNVDWINGDMPDNFIAVALPQPIAEGEFEPEVTPEATDTHSFQVGDLLAVTQGVLAIYADPIGTADLVGTLVTGDELIITDGPLQAGDTIWYRVQTLEFTGWISQTSALAEPGD